MKNNFQSNLNYNKKKNFHEIGPWPWSALSVCPSILPFIHSLTCPVLKNTTTLPIKIFNADHAYLIYSLAQCRTCILLISARLSEDFHILWDFEFCTIFDGLSLRFEDITAYSPHCFSRLIHISWGHYWALQWIWNLLIWARRCDFFSTFCEPSNLSTLIIDATWFTGS